MNSVRTPSSVPLPARVRARAAAWLLALAVLPGSLQAAGLANDSLRDAAWLSGNPGTLNGTTLGAGLEAGEPMHAGLVSGGSVWYRCAAFSGGTLSLTATGQGYTARVAVYRQSEDSPLDFAHLTPVTSGASGAAQFTLAPGGAYFIAVASGIRGSGPFTLAWKQTPPAGGGVDLVVIPESVHASVITRGFSAGECSVLYGCTTAGTNRVIAIDFEMANRGKEDYFLGNPTRSPLTLPDPCITAEHHFYGVYRFVLRDEKNVIVKMNEPLSHCVRDDRQENASAVSTRRFHCDVLEGIQAGWVYHAESTLACHLLDVSDLPAGNYSLEVVADPWNRVAETNESNNSVRVPIVLDADCTGAPANDARANALVLSGASATALGNTECATKEPGEKQHVAGTPPGRSVWFQWTAPYTGEVVANTEGSNFDTVMDVQTAATSGVNGATLKSNDDMASGVAQSQIRFNATAGTTYWFAVDGFNLGAGSQGGRLTFNINPAANNLFDGAQALAGAAGEASGNTAHADHEAGEPSLGDAAAAHSVWFRWTPAGDGPVTFKTTGSSFKALLRAFTGSSLSGLAPAPGLTSSVDPTGAAQVTFTASAAQTYMLVLDGAAGASGPFRLAWNQSVLVPVEVRIGAVRQAGGSVRLTVTGRDGQVFAMQRSADLKAWTDLGSATVKAGQAVFLDATAADGQRGFYRAVAQ